MLLQHNGMYAFSAQWINSFRNFTLLVCFLCEQGKRPIARENYWTLRYRAILSPVLERL